MNLLSFRNLFTFYNETPDPASGGGAGTATAPSTGQAPQGQQPPQGQAGFRQYFPNVPDEHWALIEPHVGQIEAYTTQLQQQSAPYRQLEQAGYTADAVQRLVAFDQRFNQNPLEMWIEIGRRLQQADNGQQPIVDPDVDLEYLAALARGEDPDAGSVPGGVPGQSGADQTPGAQTPEVQALLGHIAQLQAQVQNLQGELQQDRVQRQHTVQDQLYERRKGQMREALKNAGWPEDFLTDETLDAEVIVHRGDFARATKAMIDRRSGLLKGFTQQRQENQPGQTELPNGTPPTTPREERQRDAGDPWKRGTRSAEARLKRLNQSG